jgi:hypothetical protein
MLKLGALSKSQPDNQPFNSRGTFETPPQEITCRFQLWDGHGSYLANQLILGRFPLFPFFFL